MIVQLAMPFTAEGELSEDGAVASQRARIKDLQSSLLTRLRRFSLGAVSKSESTPQLTLEVGVDALRALLEAPEVAAITEDEMNAGSDGMPGFR